MVLNLFNEWAKSKLPLSEFLKSKGFTYSQDPKSEYRKVGKTLIRMIGQPVELQLQLARNYEGGKR